MLPAAFGPAHDGDRRRPERGESADQRQHRAVVALADRRSQPQRDQGAEGDAASGAKIFKKCKACHTVEAGGKRPLLREIAQVTEVLWIAEARPGR